MTTTTDPATRTVRTACPLDCPDACALQVEVTGDGSFTVDAQPPGVGHTLTDGFICGKVRRIARHVDCPERLQEPLRRVGPKGPGARFERISWDAALDAIAERWRGLAGGPEALLPVCYGGSNGLLTQDAADAILFRRFGAARLLRTVCAAATGAAAAALYGRMPGGTLPDVVHAKLIVIWGCNPSASGIHLVPIVQEAVKRGARLVVIDPRRTPLARSADLHLAPRPGTDLPLALAVIAELFASGHADLEFLGAKTTGWEQLRAAAAAWSIERAAEISGVPAEDIRRFAELYGTTRPAVVRMGWGQERNRNGGFASAAILALPAVAGHFGVPGSGYLASSSRTFQGEVGDAAPDVERARRVVNMNQLGAELVAPEDSAIEALYVYNCNPLATLPDQERVRRGLLRDDLFTVVHEAVHTDTCDYADLVLPATTFLEHEDLHMAYGAVALQAVKPAIPRRGSSRTNHEVAVALLERLGLGQTGEDLSMEALRARILAARPDPAVDAQRLEDVGRLAPTIGERPVAFRDMRPLTSDGMVHLWPDEFEGLEGLEPYQYRELGGELPGALALISPAVAGTVSSTFAQLSKRPARLGLHPDDAAERGLVAGQEVRVHNELGEVLVELELDADLRPGVACLVKGLWARHTANGATSNALCPDTLTDIGGGACFNDARVRVEAR